MMPCLEFIIAGELFRPILERVYSDGWLVYLI